MTPRFLLVNLTRSVVCSTPIVSQCWISSHRGLIAHLAVLFTIDLADTDLASEDPRNILVLRLKPEMVTIEM